MIKASIFDYGGVLMRTEDMAPRRKWAARIGMPTRRLEKLVFDNPVSARATIGLASVEDIWQHVAERLSLNPDELVKLRKDFWDGDRLDTILTDFVSSQRPMCRTAVLSNAWPGTRRVFEQRPELTAAFETWIISAEEGIAKPDPEIFMRALGRLEVSAEEVAFVDDMAVNVEAACKLGMAGIEFHTTEQTLRDLQRLL